MILFKYDIFSIIIIIFIFYIRRDEVSKKLIKFFHFDDWVMTFPPLIFIYLLLFFFCIL